AVGIAVGVEREPYFVDRRFFSRSRRRRRRGTPEFFRRLPGRTELLPEQRGRRHLSRRILFLQSLELAFQLPQRKWHPHLRRDEKCLDKKHCPEKKQHCAHEQDQAQSWPALTTRIGENKRGDGIWGNVLHGVAMIVQAPEEENPILWLSW